MDRKSVEGFIPDRAEYYERLRRARFGATVACLYCGSEDVIKKGTTGKDAQKYRCKECDSWVNDLTGTLFEHPRCRVIVMSLQDTRAVFSAVAETYHRLSSPKPITV